MIYVVGSRAIRQCTGQDISPIDVFWFCLSYGFFFFLGGVQLTFSRFAWLLSTSNDMFIHHLAIQMLFQEFYLYFILLRVGGTNKQNNQGGG